MLATFRTPSCALGVIGCIGSYARVSAPPGAGGSAGYAAEEAMSVEQHLSEGLALINDMHKYIGSEPLEIATTEAEVEESVHERSQLSPTASVGSSNPGSPRVPASMLDMLTGAHLEAAQHQVAVRASLMSSHIHSRFLTMFV